MSPPNEPFRWQDDWPVQADNPVDGAREQPTLATGETLRAISGSDIYWPRKRTTHRGLLLLPGILSLREEARKKAPVPTPLPPVDDDDDEDDEKAISNGSNKASNEEEACLTKVVEGPAGKASAAAAHAVPRHDHRILGRLAKVQSGEPVLTLGEGITIKGRTLETRSKFLVLQLLPAKKGSRGSNSHGIHRQQVLCKGVFSSLTVFGQGSFVTDAASTNGTTDAAEGDRANDESTTTTTSWNHYGGSERAVDGSMGRKRKASIAIARNSIISKPSRKDDPEILSDNETSRSEEDDGTVATEQQVVVAVESRPSRTVPKRASRNRHVSYGDDTDETSDEKDTSGSDRGDSSGDDDSEEDYKPSAVPTRPKGTSHAVRQRQTVADDDVPSGKGTNFGSRQTGAKFTVVRKSNKVVYNAAAPDSSDDSEMVDQPARPKRKASVPKRQTEVRATIDTANEDDTPTAVKQRASTGRRNRAIAAMETEFDDDDDENVVSGTKMSGNSSAVVDEEREALGDAVKSDSDDSRLSDVLITPPTATTKPSDDFNLKEQNSVPVHSVAKRGARRQSNHDTDTAVDTTPDSKPIKTKRASSTRKRKMVGLDFFTPPDTAHDDGDDDKQGAVIKKRAFATSSRRSQGVDVGRDNDVDDSGSDDDNDVVVVTQMSLNSYAVNEEIEAVGEVEGEKSPPFDPVLPTVTTKLSKQRQRLAHTKSSTPEVDSSDDDEVVEVVDSAKLSSNTRPRRATSKKGPVECDKASLERFDEEKRVVEKKGRATKKSGSSSTKQDTYTRSEDFDKEQTGMRTRQSPSRTIRNSTKAKVSTKEAKYYSGKDETDNITNGCSTPNHSTITTCKSSVGIETIQSSSQPERKSAASFSTGQSNSIGSPQRKGRLARKRKATPPATPSSTNIAIPPTSKNTRRRRTPQKPGSSAQLAIDLDDDDFSFLG